MSKDDRIGAIWRSSSNNERAPFAKGTIELDGRKIPVVLWPNRYKEEDLRSPDKEKRERAHRQPDFHIELDHQERKEAPQRADSGSGYTRREDRPQDARKVPPASAQRGFEDDFTDDIPF